MSVKNVKRISISVISGFVGFILSPFSWWNDLFVNFPLAYIMTWPIGKFFSFYFDVSFSLFLGIFIINYWITNILGFLLMHFGFLHYKQKKINKTELWKTAFWTTLYTLIVCVLVTQADIREILDFSGLIPGYIN